MRCCCRMTGSLTCPPSNIVGRISRRYAHVHIKRRSTVKRLEKSNIALISEAIFRVIVFGGFDICSFLFLFLELPPLLPHTYLPTLSESYFLVLGPNGPSFLCVICFGGKAGTVWSLELGLRLRLTRDQMVPLFWRDHY
jgi:hypothetical protein